MINQGPFIQRASSARPLLPEDIGGILFDLNPNDATVWADTAMTTPASVDGLVAAFHDSVTPAIVATQSTENQRPTLRQNANGKRYLHATTNTRRMFSAALSAGLFTPLVASTVTAVAWVWAESEPVAAAERFVGFFQDGSANGAHQFSVRDNSTAKEWVFRRYADAALRTSNVLIGTFPGYQRMTMLTKRFIGGGSWVNLAYVNASRVARQTTADATDPVQVLGVFGNAAGNERIHQDGRLYRFTIFDRPLTPSEISRLYQGTALEWGIT